MKIFEVWEYGKGRGARLRYKVEIGNDAIEKYLSRKTFNGNSFKEYLMKDLKYKKIIICVKDPFKRGTRRKPNYPEVLHIEFEN